MEAVAEFLCDPLTFGLGASILSIVNNDEPLVELVVELAAVERFVISLAELFDDELFCLPLILNVGLNAVPSPKSIAALKKLCPDGLENKLLGDD